jgi:hypothetical protein
MQNDFIKPNQYGISSSVCDYILRHQISETQPLSIVDFGAGAGKNARISREILSKEAKIIGVEGYKETVHMLNNLQLYDEVKHTLIQQWINSDSAYYDLAIFGDVLEHLKPKEIHYIIKKCRSKFKKIIIICPLYEIFQEELYGNALEIHQTYITSSFFDKYNPIEKHIIYGKEWTMMNVVILDSIKLKPLYRRFFVSIFNKAILLLQPIGLARPFVIFIKSYFMKYKWLLRD